MEKMKVDSGRFKKGEGILELKAIQLTAVAAVPLLGDSAETVLPRPRLHSAPIPRLEITRPAETTVIRTRSNGITEYRPRSSMA